MQVLSCVPHLQIVRYTVDTCPAGITMQLRNGDASLPAALCNCGSVLIYKHTNCRSATLTRCCCYGCCCFITDCTLGLGPHDHACGQMHEQHTWSGWA